MRKQKSKHSIVDLILRHKQNLLSSDERSILDAWINETQENQDFFQEALNDNTLLNEYIGRERARSLSDKNEVWDLLLSRGVIPKPKVFWLNNWYKYTVAAVLLVGLTLVAYIIFNGSNSRLHQAATESAALTRVEPGRVAATLILSDGRKVVLDSATSQTYSDHNVKLNNYGGRLSYGPTPQTSEGAAIYNTLTTTNGQIYAIQLADNSKVWLNAASSVRYPLSFPGTERVIELLGKGEILVEVAHDNQKPFKVLVNGVQVQATGTIFNISHYTDNTITTLVEGGVKITPASGLTKVLKPGQQARILKADNSVQVTSDVDMNEVLGWKNGLFVFNKASVSDIMKNLERWYNVNTRFEDRINDLTFTGMISRNNNIIEVLELLEAMQEVHFKLEGRTIVVSR